jgi:outer membrane protein assembly factor BamB
MNRILKSFTVSLCALVFATSAAGQATSAGTYIEPGADVLPVGASQEFQLLHEDGAEQSSTSWILSDPTLADIRIENGRAIVTGKATGIVFLSNDSGAPQASIHVLDGRPLGLYESRWLLQPIDGHFVHAFWSATAWGGQAADTEADADSEVAYYYEDRGPLHAHIRAVSRSGLQVWQWPAQAAGDDPRMICGDSYGGVLLQIGAVDSRVLVDLDMHGRERWRVDAPGFSGKDFTYTQGGSFFILEDFPARNAAALVGLNGLTGEKITSFELPPSRETLRGVEFRNGKFICAPEKQAFRSLPLQHSHLMSNTEGTANFAFSELLISVENSDCSKDQVLQPERLHLRVTQRLKMVDIARDFSAFTYSVEENTAEGNAAKTSYQVSLPTGDLIVGEQGTGNFLAVRKQTQFWLTSQALNPAEFQYRITEDRSVKYRFPANATSGGFPTNMLLGETMGYTTRGHAVIAFDLETGQELWRWVSPKSNVLAVMAAKGEMVLLHEGDGYTMIKDGKVVYQRDDDFMLFVSHFRPDWDNF